MHRKEKEKMSNYVIHGTNKPTGHMYYYGRGLM